jgi:hypothetical protein
MPGRSKALHVPGEPFRQVFWLSTVSPGRLPADREDRQWLRGRRVFWSFTAARPRRDFTAFPSSRIEA